MEHEGLSRKIVGGVLFHFTVYFHKRLFGYFKLGRSFLGDCVKV